MPDLIAVDWGTSSLRGARLDEVGRVLEEKSALLGILDLPNGDFAGVFTSLFSNCMKPAGSVCLISGMAGSRQGWVPLAHQSNEIILASQIDAGAEFMDRMVEWTFRE